MELLQIETAVASHEQKAFESEPSFLNHIRNNACRALAERMVRDTSLYRRIDPTEKELCENPFAPVRHRWRVGVERNMSELEARERQMDEARRAALRDAASAVREHASRYDRVDGVCKWVIISALHDAAKELDRLAVSNGEL
jgi:hypothetical protein